MHFEASGIKVQVAAGQDDSTDIAQQAVEVIVALDRRQQQW